MRLGDPFALVALSLMLAATQVFPFVVVRDGEGDELLVHEAVLVIMFVLLPEGGVLVGVLAGSSLCHLFRPHPPMKALYNHATHAVAVCVGLLVQRVVVGAGPGGDAWELVGAGVGVALSSVVTAVLVWAVLAVVTGRTMRELAVPGMRFDALVCIGAVGWGLVAVASSPNPVVLVLLCLAPAVLLRQLQHVVRQRHHLQILLDGAAEMAAAVPSGAVAPAVLRAARAALGGTESVIRTEPPTGDEIGAPLPSPSGRRWLVATGGHRRDPFRDDGRAVLEGLASMARIALDNVSLLERVGRDPVTGLPAGPLLLARLDHALGDSNRTRPTACLAVKIGRLDVIKQTFGPGSANVVLAEVGSRLSGVAASGDGPAPARAAVGYLGDGEFAFVVPEVRDRSGALAMAAEVERAMRPAVSVAGIDVGLNVSVGIALSGGPTATSAPAAEVLVRDAIATAARIARVGGDRTAIAEPGEGDEYANRLALEADLRAALDRGEVVVHYQPVVQVATGRLVGAEALARWEHPTLGLVSPSEFVPLAEETGLIVDLDRQVLVAACHQLASWDAAGTVGGAFTLSVNLSARQLAQDDLINVVGDVLASTGIDPRRLCLELTESGVMHDAAAAAAVLRDLRSLGVQLAIDDFGTGYSSLAYLRDFPVDAVKIDRSFIEHMTDTAGDAAIVAGTVRLAHALGLRVVAEGVEHPEQLAQLRMVGCDAAQGYHWGAAVPGDQFAASLPTPDHDTRSTAAGTTDESTDHTVVGADHDDVLAHLTHEMRTPLTVMVGFADLLAEGTLGDGDDATTFARTIAANGRDLAGLLDTLEDARDVRLGTISLNVEPLPLPALVESVVEAMRPQLAPHPVHVTTTGRADVIADDPRLRQVVRNLVSNAAKFSPPTATIDVSVRREDGRVRVSVRDHGPGVPAERQHELFRRFSRLGSQSKGLGIGLHLARTIALAHGGDITYEPASPGSRFTVELPVADPALAAGAALGGTRDESPTVLR